MDLLGDPAGFLDNLGTGVSLFISNSDGVGTKLLIKGVIGVSCYCQRPIE